MIKGVIFDLDGTLLNTLEDLKNAVNYALIRKHKEPIDLLTTKSYIGNGIKRLVTLALNESDENIINDALKDFKEYYANHILDNTKCYDNVVETLNYLKENNIKIAVVSNKYQQGLSMLCNHFFKDYSDIFIGDDGITPLKPNVEMVNKALKQLNLSNKECLYVGDSKVDILTAKNVKIKNVSVTYGYQDIKVLKTYENDYLIDNIKEIINIIIKENQND